MPYLSEEYGNPSSAHWMGQQARRGLDAARKSVAEMIGAKAGEIVFTSGGTEQTISRFAVRCKPPARRATISRSAW